MDNIRIFYNKIGRSKYISHLDINRCMQRALKRAHLDVWYTQGFNPHMYITFPMPTSLGFQSYCECMDFRLNEKIPFEEIKQRLNQVLPEGIEVTSVSSPIMKPETISEIEYALIISSDSVNSNQLNMDFHNFFEKEEIIVDKKTKKGITSLDIKPHIKLMSTSVLDNKKVKIRAMFTSGIMFSINPMLLLNSFISSLNYSVEVIDVIKKRLITTSKENFI